MRKRYVLLVIVIISVVIFNVPKSYANNKLDSIELKENSDINKEAFAMYVENSLGQYEPYTEDSNYFPNSLKYHYNGEMSKCVDSKEEVVEGILKHNDDNSVTVTSNKTVYCYLYFDLDEVKPNTPNVSLSNVSNIDSNYTNKRNQTVTVTYTDNDIESYCISLNSDTCNEYKTEGLNNGEKTITIKDFDLGEDGSKTIKVWLKDMAGNISETPGSITKTLDTQVPVISNLTVNGVTTYGGVIYVTNANPSVTITWSNDDVAKYCMSNVDCTPGTDTSVKTVTAAVTLTNNTANTIHAKIMDKAGNVSVDKTYTLTVDTIKPTVKNVTMDNLSTTNNTYVIAQKPTITVTFDDADVISYCASLNNTCSTYVTTGLSGKTITLSSYDLGSAEGSKTVNVWLKDKAGNISQTAGSITKTLDTATPGAPTVKINNGASITESTTVSVSVTGIASDVGWYCIVNSNSDCTPGTAHTSTTLTLSSHNLSAGDGSKTVCVRIKDKAGHVSTKGCASITLQTSYTASALPSKNPAGLKNVSKGDLTYRFVGTSTATVNNYICFGTDNKATCTGNTDTYMYRIIGIDTKGRLKLIKNTSIGNKPWSSSDSSDYVWDTSKYNVAYLSSNLNGTGFYSNTNYVPTAWQSKIDNTTWYLGRMSKDDGTDIGTSDGDVIYYKETKTTGTAKIGLMYMSDYYYAWDGTGSAQCTINGYTTCKNSWLHISNNGNASDNNSDEWLIDSTYVVDREERDYYYAWYINSSGRVGSKASDYYYAVRPTFYLTSTTKIKSGTGTSSDPFIIA